MSAPLVDALLDSLDDDALVRLAERLRPHLQLVVKPADDGWLRGASAIADYLGCPRSRVYALVSAGRLPAIKRDGSALVARRGDLDKFIADGGARRP